MSDLPAYSSLLRVRPEVLDNEGLLDMVDLARAGTEVPKPPKTRSKRLADRAPVSDAYKDAQAFFALTYPTEDVRQTLTALQARLSGGRAVAGTIVLTGSYGLGKSHVLLAAHHALHQPAVVRAWSEHWDLPEPITLAPNIRVVTRNFIQRTAENLWQVLFEAVGRPELSDSVSSYPDGEQITALLDDRPTFLILDELERWYDALPENMQSRNRNFLQALTEVANRDPRITLLTSVLGERMEPAETLRRVRPLELSFRSSEDRQEVLLYRLFENRRDLDQEAVADTVASTVDRYLDSYRRAGLDNLDSYRQRMLRAYPFTPEFLDIITKKIPNLGGFQNTRGSLRFLSKVVQATHAQRPLVSSQDLPLDDRELSTALGNLDSSGGEVVRRALGDNREAVPDTLEHKDELFSTILFYSIADPSQPGVSEHDLLLSVLDPGENPNRVKDSLRRLHAFAFNLHVQNDRYVFLAQENPHARINAVARSPQVTDEACRGIVVDALLDEWSAHDRTAVFTGDVDEVSKKLAALGGKRPLYLISTQILEPALRLALQNCHGLRNLVLLIEPRFDSEKKTSAHYDVARDTELRERARLIQACLLLLESRPDETAAVVYREVSRREKSALAADIAHRYGRYTSWHRAGVATADVDESWYELGHIDKFEANHFLEHVKKNYSGAPHIKARVHTLSAVYQRRRARDLIDHFERTPGEPVPYDVALVPEVLRELAREGAFGLEDGRGHVYCRDDVRSLSADALPGCVLVPAPARVEAPRPRLVMHTFVSAHYDLARKSVLVQWEIPEHAPEHAETLVQRYPNAKGWEQGKEYNLDLDITHENNRYLGRDGQYIDDQGLTPGARYFYYVFLVDRHSEPPRIVLSQRCDVHIQEEAQPPPENEIHVAVQPKQHKLLAELERHVMSARYMTAERRARKLEFRFDEVSDLGALLDVVDNLGDNLGKDGATVNLAADVTITVRGHFDRQAILAMTRKLPKVEAGYSAKVFLVDDSADE